MVSLSLYHGTGPRTVEEHRVCLALARLSRIPEQPQDCVHQYQHYSNTVTKVQKNKRYKDECQRRHRAQENCEKVATSVKHTGVHGLRDNVCMKSTVEKVQIACVRNAQATVRGCNDATSNWHPDTRYVCAKRMSCGT